MRYWIGIIILLLGTVIQPASAAGTGPEISLIDNKISINADSISLGRLLRLLDQATGMQSKVPREFADRNISVRFSGLSVDQAVRKIFQGQPFDYVLIGGQGVVVTGSSLTVSAPDSQAPPFAASQAQPLEPGFVQDDPPFIPPQVQPVQTPFGPVTPPPVGIQPLPGFSPLPGQNNPFNQQQQQQPAVIQTPFGPIANPRANQGMSPNGNIPVQGTSPFGQQNSFGSPVGTNNSFGNPSVNGQNDLFGNPANMQNQNPQGTANPGLFSGQPPQRRP